MCAWIVVESERATERERERERELRALATVLFFQSTLYQAEIKGKAIIIHDGAIACVFFVACVDVCDAKSCVSIVLLAAWFITVSIIGREWEKKGNNSGDLLTQSCNAREERVTLLLRNTLTPYPTEVRYANFSNQASLTELSDSILI